MGWPRRIFPVRRPQPSGLQTRAPMPLIEAERHQFPFVFSADERIVNLMPDVTWPAVAIGDGERLHQVPAGKI